MRKNTGFEEDSSRRSHMASMDFAPTQESTVLEEQQSLLKSGPANGILELQCSSGRASSGRESGLRRRLPKNTMDSDGGSDNAEETFFLSDQTAESSRSSFKARNGFARSIEKYLSTCRLNVRFKPRRPATSKILVTPPQNTQTDLEGVHSSKVPCLGRAWRGLRKRLGDMIKIEEEISVSVPRSVLYYA